MPREIFLNDAEDVKWLKATHLKIEFKSFFLRGNEDAPDELLLFKEKNPKVGDTPVAVIRFPW